MMHHHHSIQQRFFGAEKARAAEKMAATRGLACVIVPNANGCTGMYSRTDAVITRPMTQKEAEAAMCELRSERLARTLIRQIDSAMTRKEIDRIDRANRDHMSDRVKDVLRRRRIALISMGADMARLGIFYHFYYSGLSSLACRQIDTAIKHGVTTFAGLHEWAAAHAADDTCRGAACRELIHRIGE